MVALPDQRLPRTCGPWGVGRNDRLANFEGVVMNVGNSGTATGVNNSLVIGLTFVATLGGLLFGYDTAVISGAVNSIDAYFINPLGWSETARSSLSGWTISSALV